MDSFPAVHRIHCKRKTQQGAFFNSGYYPNRLTDDDIKKEKQFLDGADWFGDERWTRVDLLSLEFTQNMLEVCTVTALCSFGTILTKLSEMPAENVALLALVRRYSLEKNPANFWS